MSKVHQKSGKNFTLWEYNLPLQVWPQRRDPDDEESPVEGWVVLNYMPRKEHVVRLPLGELLGEQAREEYLMEAAAHLENLARLMREAAEDPEMLVYFPDEGMLPADTAPGGEQ